MERLHIVTSESETDFLLLQKKMKRFRLVVMFSLALIILVVVFAIAFPTISTWSKENDEISHESNRTENNAIVEEIGTLRRSYSEMFSAISRANNHVIEMEKRTNQSNDEILGRINEMTSAVSESNYHAIEMEKRTNQSNCEILGKFTEISSAISGNNNRPNEMERRMNKRIDEISSTISGNNDRTNEIEKRSNRMNDEIQGRIREMSSVVSELQFKLERKNSVFKLKQNNFCLDTIHGTKNSSLELFPCHDLGHNQEWQFTVDEEMKNRKSCLTFTKNTHSNSVQVILDECNGSASQKCKFISGVLQSIEYDVCVQTKGKVVFAANCDSAIATQKFERKLLYKIDQVCTFKQGAYVLLGARNVIVANNGFLLHDTLCLDFTLTWKLCDKNSNNLKWEYTDDGQIRNKFENNCLDNMGTVALSKCNSNSRSQKWICDHEPI